MDIEKEPSIGISYTVELPGKKALVLQSFVARDCEKADLDKVLDKVRIAADRQFAVGAIQQLKLQLEQEQKLAYDHAERMEQVDRNIKLAWGDKRGDPQLSKREREQQLQAHAHAEECKKRIAKVKADMAEYEAMIGA